MLDIRTPLIAEFLKDHQQFSRLLYEISKLLKENDIEKARQRAQELDEMSGAHIAYEEAELGFRLTSRGWKLKRIDVPGIKHYGYDTSSFGVFKKRWKTGYVKGSGEFLRASFGTKFFFSTLLELKIYVFLVKWWALLIVSLALLFLSPYVFLAWLAVSIMGLLAIIVKKRSLHEGLFSLVSWHYSALGLVWGFFSRRKNPLEKIDSRVIQ